MARALPLGWTPTRPCPDDRVFGIVVEAESRYGVSMDGGIVSRHESPDYAVDALRKRLFTHVLSTPRERVFLHAGCVAHDGAAILLPGSSAVGKTTLVAALVRAGAVYYTDDYAPLDRGGDVHPYPLPMWMSDPQTGLGRERRAEDLGATVGQQPLAVSVVAQTAFREAAGWDVRSCSDSEAVLLLLEYAVNPQRQPEFALAAMREVVRGAVVLRGERGDADEAAATLLEVAERRARPRPA